VPHRVEGGREALSWETYPANLPLLTPFSNC
jgi:hypothetical protein